MMHIEERERMGPPLLEMPRWVLDTIEVLVGEGGVVFGLPSDRELFD